MRILQLISSTGFYGAESMMTSLSITLKTLGCHVEIAVFNVDQMPALDQALLKERSGVAIHSLRHRGQFDPFAIGRLVKLIRAQKIDVLHCHGYKADVLGFLAARFTKCKVIATCHNWTGATAQLKWYGRLDRLVLRHIDVVVSVSDDVYIQLLKAGISRRRLLHVVNGIDIASYSGDKHAANDPHEPVLGVIARLSPEKGVDVLIRALPPVIEIFPSLTCRVVGKGSEQVSLLKLIRKLHLTDHVRIEGFCSDIKAFLKECTIVALPSLTEGTPIAALEAMASCTPLVASSVGNLPLLLLNGEAGLLVPPANANQLGKSLIRLLSDANLRHYLAARALENVTRNFDLKVMASHYLGIYNEVCSQHSISTVSHSFTSLDL